MSWKPCPACLYEGGIQFLCRGEEHYAVCPRCMYVMAKGQTRSEVASEYTRKYRVIE